MKIRRNDLGVFIRENGYLSGLELGVKDVRSMAAMLHQNPSLRLVGIDLWEDMPGSSPYKNNSRNLSFAVRRMEKYLFRNVHLYRGNCLQLAHKIQDHSLDFIFYDLYDFRSSNVDFVKSVLSAYLPKLKRDSGGIIIGRDFHQQDVQDAFSSLNLPSPKQCIINGIPHERIKYTLVAHDTSPVYNAGSNL